MLTNDNGATKSSRNGLVCIWQHLRTSSGWLPWELWLHITFEESILSILPSALFLLIVPNRLLHVYRGSKKVRRSTLQILKLVSFWRTFNTRILLSHGVPRSMLLYILLCRLNYLSNGQSLVYYGLNCQWQQERWLSSTLLRLVFYHFSITVDLWGRQQFCNCIYLSPWYLM